MIVANVIFDIVVDNRIKKYRHDPATEQKSFTTTPLRKLKYLKECMTLLIYVYGVYIYVP